ncbi:MAG TPA: carboxypeptidase regulatory-like domain-containing protein, partial [Rhodanobacteraceae bacterium]|nr:carboxypeptidase regulatory-like domain-containing protein [Rhodanobacteraceae bacterium]
MTSSVQHLYARLHAVAREIDQASASHHAPAASIDARIAALHKDVDALTRPSRTPVAARDLVPLRVLLHNIERKRELPATTRPIVPAHRDVGRRAVFTTLDASHGAQCVTAYALAADGEVDGFLAAGATLWLRIDARHSKRIALTTAATPLATSIELFDACATAEPAVPGVSAAGLGASVGATVPRAGVLWARVRNLGDAGNVAVIAAPDEGAIEGHVTDATSGDPLGNATVIAFGDGDFYSTVYVQADGTYSLDLADGSYSVLAGLDHYVAEAWPDQLCASVSDPNSCIGGPPQRVDVAGDTVGGIDFALGHGASIAGRVREQETNLAINDGFVNIFDADGYQRAGVELDAAGRYVADGLIAGTYRATAISFTHGAQAYDGIPCPGGCDITNATPIEVAADALVSGIDFSLPRAYYIEATVHATGVDPAEDITVEVFDLAGVIVTAQIGVLADTPTPIGPLSQGSYYVGARASDYREQLFDHVDCDLYCYPPDPDATRIVVSSANPAPSATFDLQPLATVSGVITDAATHAGLAGQVVTLWSATDPAFQLAGGLTDFDGTYRVTGAPAGAAWLVVTSWDHRDTAYPDAPCNDFAYGDIQACDLGSATPIAIDNGANVTGIDVALPMNGSISGTVRTRGAGDFAPPLAFAYVRIFVPDGTNVDISPSVADGTYSITDLPPGTYFARVDANDYFSQRWPSVDCATRDADCSGTGGSPIAVAVGQQVEAIDFDPVGAFNVVGRVIDAITGAGVSDVALDLWLAQTNEHCLSA